jgi:hypothetical protein
MQSLAEGLSAEKIEALIRKWQARLPQPFTAAERAAGYDYEISILQAEFALTQVLDRPQTGRLFFEAAIRIPGVSESRQILPASRRNTTDTLLAELSRAGRHPLYTKSLEKILPLLGR